MKQVKKKFSHESLQDAQSIKAILKSITNGLAKGKVVLSDEQDDVVLEPKGLLALKVTATQDAEQNSLDVRIKWRTDPEVPKKRKLIVSDHLGKTTRSGKKTKLSGS